MPGQLILIAWDAADWKILHPLIDAGEMPTLRRIVETGASGSLLSTQPIVPVAQLITLATGKRPWQHRVCHPLEWNAKTNAAVPVTAEPRRARAVWEILAQKGKRSLVVGWPATHGAQFENTVLVSDCYAQPTAAPGIKPWPPSAPGTYWPDAIRARLDAMRMSPEDVGSDLIAHYIPDWKKIDQKRDRRLGQLRLFLATDFSHQVALMSLLSHEPWDFATVRFPALGAVSQLFLSYHLPQGSWIPEASYELYHHVIRGACRMLDQLLSRLLQIAGEDMAIVIASSHGVSRHILPPSDVNTVDNESWKSPHGIFAACGPGFATDTLVCGATVLDVAPTILAWFGLPIGDDMEGRVLIEGFAKPPEIARTPSWEPSPSNASVSRFTEGVTTEIPKAAAPLQRESDWNLAQSYLDAGRHGDALPILEQLFRSFPERIETGNALFHCQIDLKNPSGAAETLEVSLEGLPPGIWSILLQAELCLAQKQNREARSLVSEAWSLRPNHPDVLRRLGWLMLHLHEWDALADLARQALALDENDALAWLGLAEAQLRKRLPAEAQEAAMRAIGLNYYMPEAHFVLARALIALGKWAEAREAMQVLLRLQPDNRVASTYANRIDGQTDR